MKREEHGWASTWLHTGVRAGDDLQAAAPRGAFVLQDLREDTLPVVFVSAGVGVTPLLAMLHALADDAEAPRHPVWWLHATRNEHTHAFAGEVRRLLARLPGARLRVFYSRPEPAARLTAGTTAGRLTADTVTRLGLPGDAQAYVCGPEPFMRDVTEALRHQGIRHIHTEIFGSGPGSTPGIADRKRPSPHSLPSSGPGPGSSSPAAR